MLSLLYIPDSPALSRSHVQHTDQNCYQQWSCQATVSQQAAKGRRQVVRPIAQHDCSKPHANDPHSLDLLPAHDHAIVGPSSQAMPAKCK
jgi:hypothetical protein